MPFVPIFTETKIWINKKVPMIKTASPSDHGISPSFVELNGLATFAKHSTDGCDTEVLGVHDNKDYVVRFERGPGDSRFFWRAMGLEKVLSWETSKKADPWSSTKEYTATRGATGLRHGAKYVCSEMQAFNFFNCFLTITMYRHVVAM